VEHDATHSRLGPVVDVAKMLACHEQGVLNYFSAAPVTNATAEGLNSKIQTIKKMAYGFRNKDHFKTANFFHCGAYSSTRLPTELPDDPYFVAEAVNIAGNSPPSNEVSVTLPVPARAHRVTTSSLTEATWPGRGREGRASAPG
jgi:hypothetical protein